MQYHAYCVLCVCYEDVAVAMKMLLLLIMRTMRKLCYVYNLCNAQGVAVVLIFVFYVLCNIMHIVYYVCTMNMLLLCVLCTL